jgi:hypothetical protein
MNNNALLPVGNKMAGTSRREFLGSAMAVVATGTFLDIAVAGDAQTPAAKTTFYVGTASADIAPSQPVALDGQMGLRVAKSADTPITANVIALESREGDRSLDVMITVSCDLVQISDILSEKVLQAVQKRLPGFDPKKLIINATHTHTAPVTRPGIYEIPSEAIQPEPYCEFAAERIAEAIEKAWKQRTPGSVTWGLGHAAIAENRRATYGDGSAVMYGNTNTPDFRGFESNIDHDVNALFFWNGEGKLIAMAIDIPCPSQEVEGLSTMNADFWHPTRELLRQRYGQDLGVVAWTGAAGEFSPHLMYRKAAEERMLGLRKLSRLQEIARRIVAAVDEIFETVKDDRHTDVPLIHKTETVQLPMRLVTDAEYNQIRDILENKHPCQMEKTWHERVIKRYEDQKTNPQPVCETTVHVVRIGDVVLCTTSFELFSDFGIQIQARSKALQTFVVQLAGSPTSYLPIKRAVEGGGYSAIVQSNLVGPEGGQVLVNKTVELIDSLWAN